MSNIIQIQPDSDDARSIEWAYRSPNSPMTRHSYYLMDIDRDKPFTAGNLFHYAIGVAAKSKYLHIAELRVLEEFPSVHDLACLDFNFQREWDHQRGITGFWFRRAIRFVAAPVKNPNSYGTSHIRDSFEESNELAAHFSELFNTQYSVFMLEIIINVSKFIEPERTKSSVCHIAEDHLFDDVSSLPINGFDSTAIHDNNMGKMIIAPSLIYLMSFKMEDEQFREWTGKLEALQAEAMEMFTKKQEAKNETD